MINDIRPRQRDEGGQHRTSAAKAEKDESVSVPVFDRAERINDPALENPDVKLPQNIKAGHDEKQSGFKKFLSSRTKKQWSLITSLLLIAVMGGVTYETWSSRTPSDDNWAPDVSMYETKEPPKPATVASRLTGLQISPELNKNPVTGVMIENSPDARPQSGLKEAGVVFEAISEGGITRFLALYLESSPGQIGPVRSVRPYYLDLLMPFDAAIAHVGGSSQALQQISRQNIKDLDQMRHPGPYARKSHRYAPHNMYTSRKGLLGLHKQKGYTESKFNGFPRSAEKKSETPNAKHIELTPSSYLYNLRYEYNGKNNSYKRFMGGRPHTDEQSGKQLEPKVVIALVVPHSYAGIYSVYKINSSGKAYIFQNGTATEGIWEKRNRKDQIRFGDKNGSPLGINPGQTWITLVGGQNMVSFR